MKFSLDLPRRFFPPETSLVISSPGRFLHFDLAVVEAGKSSEVGTYILQGNLYSAGRLSKGTAFTFSTGGVAETLRDSVAEALSILPYWSKITVPETVVQEALRAEAILFTKSSTAMMAWCAAVLLRDAGPEAAVAFDMAQRVLDVMEVQGS